MLGGAGTRSAGKRCRGEVGEGSCREEVQGLLGCLAAILCLHIECCSVCHMQVHRVCIHTERGAPWSRRAGAAAAGAQARAGAAAGTAQVRPQQAGLDGVRRLEWGKGAGGHLHSNVVRGSWCAGLAAHGIAMTVQQCGLSNVQKAYATSKVVDAFWAVQSAGSGSWRQLCQSLCHVPLQHLSSSSLPGQPATCSALPMLKEAAQWRTMTTHARTHSHVII